MPGQNPPPGPQIMHWSGVAAFTGSGCISIAAAAMTHSAAALSISLLFLITNLQKLVLARRQAGDLHRVVFSRPPSPTTDRYCVMTLDFTPPPPLRPPPKPTEGPL